MEFRSFNQKLVKIQKFDSSTPLGIVYDSNIRFESFLIGLNFDPSAEAHKPAEREGRDPLHSVMKVGGG